MVNFRFAGCQDIISAKQVGTRLGSPRPGMLQSGYLKHRRLQVRCDGLLRQRVRTGRLGIVDARHIGLHVYSATFANKMRMPCKPFHT